MILEILDGVRAAPVDGVELHRGEDRPGPGNGRRSRRQFSCHRKQHRGRPQRADQHADAQRYDDAELIVPRRFRDHDVGNRAVHREEFTEDSVRVCQSCDSARVVKRGHGLKDGGEFMTKR